jgi:hypothetical protein
VRFWITSLLIAKPVFKFYWICRYYLQKESDLTLTMAHNFSLCGTENPNIVSLDHTHVWTTTARKWWQMKPMYYWNIDRKSGQK